MRHAGKICLVSAATIAIAVSSRAVEEDGNTLVVVTADHECAGINIIGGSRVTDADLAARAMSGDGVAAHTASDIPVSAAGPGASLFTGVMDNTDLFFKTWSSSDTPRRTAVIDIAFTSLLNLAGYHSPPG